MRRTASAQRVMTVAKGFAGLSPGAALIEITVSNAVPQAGLEFDMGKKILSLTQLEIQVWIGTLFQARGPVFVEHDTIRHGVNQEANYSFECVAPMYLFQ